jgi:quercetin dioxygenase-like cupin family protein
MIAKTLDVPLFSFFMGFNDTKDLVVRSNARKKMIFPENNNFAYELLSPDLSGAIELALMTLPPHSHSSEELMDHDGEEAAYVIDNKIELHLENQVIVLHAGDSVKILPRMKHKWENSFEHETNVIFAITPPRF